MKKSDSLRRRRAFREPRARFLIVCEGEVTEPEYFRDIRQTERGLIDLKIVPAGVPKSVVERAAGMKKDSELEAKRRKDENLRYDHVWCVFDVDVHPFVAEAKQQAMSNSIELAVSNPCFELWFLLHFQDQTAHIERDKVHHLCRKYMPGYQKDPPCDTLRLINPRPPKGPFNWKTGKQPATTLAAILPPAYTASSSRSRPPAALEVPTLPSPSASAGIAAHCASAPAAARPGSYCRRRGATLL